MTTFINLTPHPINLASPGGAGEVVIPPAGTVARVQAPPGARVQAMWTPAGWPIPVHASPVYGPVEGLPAPAADTAYLVSALVLARPEVVGRPDVFAPATGPGDGAIRDAGGRITAVTRLIAAPRQ